MTELERLIDEYQTSTQFFDAEGFGNALVEKLTRKVKKTSEINGIGVSLWERQNKIIPIVIQAYKAMKEEK